MFLHKVGILCVMLAEFLKESDRELYTFLMFCIYVDDLANSNSTIRSCIDLAKRADELLVWSAKGQKRIHQTGLLRMVFHSV